MSLHPVETTRHIRDAYIRYLKTIKPFQNAELRAEFASALEQENLLVKGPYVELTPPFKTGRTLGDLIKSGDLSRNFGNLCHAGGLELDRPLYTHQESAILKVREGRNVVVTAGTGSGKTEAFLIPILDALLREAEAGALCPGVRALLLYPMNALANDQIERLRNDLRDYPQITFGRYVGETLDEQGKALQAYRELHERDPLKNELISRGEMQASPPHILLTNYAMLEYLLLRPADSPLFDGETGDHWRFLVLDEAHAYDGAQATEIAMLLRRLEDRVTRGGRKELQAIAVSATLGEDDPESRQEIAEFATNLFNLDFEPQDVVFGERLPESGLEGKWGEGTPELYATLEKVAAKWRSGAEVGLPASLPGIGPSLLSKAGQEAQDGQVNVPRFLYEVLRGDGRVHRLRALLEGQPLALNEVAKQVFPGLPEEEAEGALANLVSVAALAQERADKARLLPARYHLFARALEGAFVCLNRDDPAHAQEGKPRLFLTRQRFCPSCGSRVFELANCTRCGTSYLVGEERPGEALPETEKSDSMPWVSTNSYLIQNSVIYENEMAARNVRYFVLEQTDAVEADEDALIEEGAEPTDENGNEKLAPLGLCPRCGALYDGYFEKRCSCGTPLVRVSRVEMDHKHTLQRCVSCSSYNKQGVIYRFLTGQDAPVGVLAGALYEDVPPSHEDEDREKPGQGRKMLIFTDNRQQAAFFAPFLQHAQDRQLRRRLMVQSLRRRKPDEPLRFGDWMDKLLSVAEDRHVFGSNASRDEKSSTVATWLMQEFSGLDKRLSLEGVGLLYFRPYRPGGWQPPAELLAAPWNLSYGDAFQVLAILLNTLRRQGAVSYLLEDEDIDLLAKKHDEFVPRSRPFYVREAGSGSGNRKKASYGIYNWLPSPSRRNGRLDYLTRLLATRKHEKTPSDETHLQAKRLLSDIWVRLTAAGNGRIWLEAKSLGVEGVVYRLSHKMWEVVPTLNSIDEWFVCNCCQNLSAFNVDGVCPTYGCGGRLEPVAQRQSVLEDNLYRFEYQQGEPLPLKAQEHTAQWTSRKAAEVQKQFTVGDLNVLSCSTTFELGVDVGDLNAVILHNMPPSTAHYVQRAGRAGRRTDSVAFVVTFAQRRPHDLSFYAEPERMIAGKLRPPVVALRNDKIIRRHLHSVVFAAFFRWAKETQEKQYHHAGDFFEAPTGDQGGPALLEQFIGGRPAWLQEALLRVIPPDTELRKRLCLENWGWVPNLVQSDEAILNRAAEEFLDEIGEFKRIEAEASSAHQYRLADQAQQVQTTIRGRDLLGYLGSKNVLPKYGFPTDVVPLKTDHINLPGARDIELERDLKIAISEFAPGGQVIAGGKLWFSGGIRKLPGRLWEPERYVICESCNRINIHPGVDYPTTCECGAPLNGGGALRGKAGVYITPEQGFVAENRTEAPGENPPERTYASQIYLAAYHPSEQANESLTGTSQQMEDDADFNAGIKVSKSYTRFGYLALINDGYGRGFRICQTCGYAEVIVPGGTSRGSGKGHRDPLTGRDCMVTMEVRQLGYHFMTDVLQLRFSLHIAGESAIQSLLYAILNGASQALEIPRNDIGGVVVKEQGEPRFLLYDTTPGGSGHVELIHNHLRPALEAAYKRVDECDGCARETSCYSCLRSYENQRVHDLLVRGTAADLLGQILGK